MGATFIFAQWILALLPINLWPPSHQRQMSVVVKVLCQWTTQGWYTTQPQDHVVIEDRCVNGNPAILLQSAWIAKWELDFGRIAKYKNMQLLLFWLCINHYWSNHVWTQISPSIAALPCSALVLHPQTQSACNPHWLCENPLDCVGLRNPSQSWLWWIAPQFGGLPRDFTGLDAHNRLSNPKNRIAIH